MSLRVVLYAEGPAELGSWEAQPPIPGSSLKESGLGPAHVLVRKVLVERTTGGAPEVVFEAPLRTAAGRVAQGSMLTEPRTLRKLLSWPRDAPHLAVVLVDEDGNSGRLASMKAALEGRSRACPAVVGVAVREFESWLITDLDTVRRVLGVRKDSFGAIEQLRPREAKQALATLMAPLDAAAQFELRKRIAAEADLAVLRQASRSFQRFDGELRSVP